MVTEVTQAAMAQAVAHASSKAYATKSASAAPAQGKQETVNPGVISGRNEPGNASQVNQSAMASEVQSVRQNLPLSQSEEKEQMEPTVDMQKVVDNLNDFVQSIKRELQFSIDDDSGRTIIKVVNQETDEVVRQIPSEEVLELQKNIRNNTNLLLHAEV